MLGVELRGIVFSHPTLETNIDQGKADSFVSAVFLCISSASVCFRYGDMRRLIGFAIRDMWYKLGKKIKSGFFAFS